MPIKSYPIILAGALAAVMAVAEAPSHTDTTPIAPIVPGTDRHTPGKVFLERADQLKADQTLGNFSILVGNVELRKGDMFMYCDSANLYEENGSVHAFGNVRMEQGDTLFVYADELDYDGSTELAVLYADEGKKVRLINRDVTLETDVFNYDMAIDLGYYDVWGTLTDKQNKLNSREGEYSPSTKEANFYIKVVLENISEKGDTLYIYSDTLNYNTDTHIADLSSPSQIVNADGTIYTRSGIFDTNTNIGDLYQRSTVHTRRGNTLTGDTLFYDHNTGYGTAFGNMILTDSVRQSAISGDYGFYNEVTDSAFVTGHALLTEYSKKDTLYVHGDTIRSFMLPDSTHIMVVNPHVRIFRNDIQGVCDSLTYLESDSTLYMNRHPIVWTGERQIFGNVIQVHM
ncbi:MAG: LPS export ABC transporter periplasmic protein LptC, partial [Muribaculaceae bacterium]|nr:LPS export ABC transporter periplasmic protein LptC [Muribaculaceae bacterium]